MLNKPSTTTVLIAHLHRVANVYLQVPFQFVVLVQVIDYRWHFLDIVDTRTMWHRYDGYPVCNISDTMFQVSTNECNNYCLIIAFVGDSIGRNKFGGQKVYKCNNLV